MDTDEEIGKEFIQGWINSLLVSADVTQTENQLQQPIAAETANNE